MRPLLLAALTIFSFGTFAAELPKGTPEDVGMSSERLERITDAVQRHIDAGNVQGAVVGVARRGQVVYLQAHGKANVEKNIPMSTDSLFQMWSSTKPVLGVAAMMMIEQGLFMATDPVSKYIPEFEGIQVAVLKVPVDEDISSGYVPRDDIPEHRLIDTHRPLTIQDLLTHTGGIGGSGLGSALANIEWTRGEGETLATLIPKYAAGPLDFQPGTRWAYSGTIGLDIVARIIEVVTKTPFNEFVHENILKPLNMKNTNWNVPESEQHRRVVAKNSRHGLPGNTTYFSGSWGLNSSVLDYLHFEQMLLNGGTLFGNRLLGPRTVEWMASNHVGDLYMPEGTNKGFGFGFTVTVMLDPVIAKSARSAGAFGWHGAMGTTSWTDPKEDLVAVILIQQMSTELHHDVANAIREAIIE